VDGFVFEVLRALRSGFRLRAQTPAKRLKFESRRPSLFVSDARSSVAERHTRSLVPRQKFELDDTLRRW